MITRPDPIDATSTRRWACAPACRLTACWPSRPPSGTASPQQGWCRTSARRKAGPLGRYPAGPCVCIGAAPLVLLPLPLGEGWGEGQPAHASKNSCFDSCQRTPGKSQRAIRPRVHKSTFPIHTTVLRLPESSQARDIERVRQRAKELQNDEQDKDPAVLCGQLP